jgi:alpha/beta superfamily hydrolase
MKKFSIEILLFFFLFSNSVIAQNVDELVSVNIQDGVQQGVITYQKGASVQNLLIVLVPGHPSVFRPAINNNKLDEKSPSYFNFLIRSREFLVDPNSMTLVVDCFSKIGDTCTQRYQSSKQRFSHLKALIDEVKSKNNSIKDVWLIGTSFGTITSGFAALHGQDYFSGAIHTATIDPTAEKSYPILSELNYKESRIPQLFVHHKNDGCAKTSYKYISDVSASTGIPLITVSGGYGWKGDVCQAMGAHGFKGKEEEVMKSILSTIRSKQFKSKEI